jgi:hypothetical protein
LKVYDQTIRVLKDAVVRATLGNDERLSALRQLDAQARTIEGHVDGASFDEFIADEKASASDYGGRTICGGASHSE